MTNLIATFEDGSEITVNSTHNRTHAFRVTISRKGQRWKKTGWAGSEALALKGARAYGQFSRPRWFDRVHGRSAVFTPDTVESLEIVPVRPA